MEVKVKVRVRVKVKVRVKARVNGKGQNESQSGRNAGEKNLGECEERIGSFRWQDSLCILTIALRAVLRRGHSARRASTGFALIARRAGR